MEDFLLINELFTEEERMIRESVRKLVDTTVIPLMVECFEKGEFPPSLVKAVAGLGLLGMTLPSEYGGADATHVAYGLACQELERGDSGLRSFVSVQSSLVMYPIFTYGSEVQRKKYLPKLASGDFIGAFGLTEPDAGSDPGSMRTTAKPVSGGYLLNGAKTWITNASIADVAIVWAKIDANNVRGFIVEKGTPGFKTATIKHKLSLRASHTGELIFEDCFIPESHYLPGSDKGLAAPFSCLTKARYGIAWGAMGAAMACYDIALEYAKERIQFSKPIASYQLVQSDLTKMFTEIVKAQMINLRIGQLMDQGKATYAMVSLAKRNACREALNIARMARNLLGANGISLEYHVMRHMNNLEAVFTYEGTDSMHTLILGRHLTGIPAFG